jgi:hypothetical protein
MSMATVSAVFPMHDAFAMHNVAFTMLDIAFVMLDDAVPDAQCRSRCSMLSSRW